MSEFQEKLRKAGEWLCQADALLIGAGAGLSAAAGLDYAGDEFRRRFADYIEKYHFTDLYSSGFYPFPTEGEKWAYWARHVDFTRFAPPALPLYLELKELAEGKNYFVVTTNVDGQFFKAGFDEKRIMAFQGDYAEMQCARACHSRVYDNNHVVEDIIAHSHDLTMDERFAPKCPVCGGPMDMHLRKDSFFVEDEAWHKAYERYMAFLGANLDTGLVLLELGVGFNTPGIIRYPFEELALHNKRARLIRVNRDEGGLPASIRERAISFQEDAARVITQLKEI